MKSLRRSLEYLELMYVGENGGASGFPGVKSETRLVFWAANLGRPATNCKYLGMFAQRDSESTRWPKWSGSWVELEEGGSTQYFSTLLFTQISFKD